MKETEMFTEKKGKEWGEQNQPKESTVLMEKERKKKKTPNYSITMKKASRFHSIK